MNSWKKWLVIAGMACVAAPALPQSKNDGLVVTGTDWMSSSVSERKAFLVGVASATSRPGSRAGTRPTHPRSRRR